MGILNEIINAEKTKQDLTCDMQSHNKNYAPKQIGGLPPDHTLHTTPRNLRITHEVANQGQGMSEMLHPLVIRSSS